MIYITSDTHFYHANIATGTSVWSGGGQREFANQYDMTEELINNINSQAGQDDIIRHGGDWSFGGLDKIVAARLKIICNNIILSLGNHDEHILANKPIPDIYLDACHARFGSNCNRLQDLFQEVTLKQTFKMDGVITTLSHYAERVWDKSHKGAIQLHGHSHAGLENMIPNDKYLSGGNHPTNKFYNRHRTMDVGIDNYYRLNSEYKMFTEREILNILLPRPSLSLLDHHGETTN
jgi:calcineurin-like phosphoesterase family protein